MDSGHFDSHHFFRLFDFDLFESINSKTNKSKVIYESSCFLLQSEMTIRNIEPDGTLFLNERIHWKIESFALRIYYS